MYKKFKKGFTLAEVLVTLTILGAVAALTLPGLIKDTNNKAMMALLEETVLNLNDTIENEFLYNPYSTLLLSTIVTDPEAFLKKNFEVAESCTPQQAPCFVQNYDRINSSNSSIATWAGTKKAVVLKNGVALHFVPEQIDTYSTENYKVIPIAMDLNGAKGPNIRGVDYFSVFLYLKVAGDEIHVGDLGIKPANLSKTLDELKALCKDDGDENACYIVAERTGFNPNYISETDSYKAPEEE